MTSSALPNSPLKPAADRFAIGRQLSGQSRYPDQEVWKW